MALLVGGFELQFAVTNPLMASRVFHLGPFGFGLFSTFMAAAGIAENYHSSRRKDPGPYEFLAWAMVFGAAECLAAVMPTAWAYDAAMVAIGAATQLFAVSATVYVQQATPPEQRGLALSAYNAGFIGFVPAGAFTVAAIAEAAGIRWALIGPGLAILTAAAALAATRPRAERAAIQPERDTESGADATARSGEKGTPALTAARRTSPSGRSFGSGIEHSRHLLMEVFKSVNAFPAPF